MFMNDPCYAEAANRRGESAASSHPMIREASRRKCGLQELVQRDILASKDTR